MLCNLSQSAFRQLPSMNHRGSWGTTGSRNPVPQIRAAHGHRISPYRHGRRSHDGLRAVESLRARRLVTCGTVRQPSSCRLLYWASVARKYLEEHSPGWNRAPDSTGIRLPVGHCGHALLRDQLGLSGYSKALSIVQRHILPALHLQRDQFILVATASRISRITDSAASKRPRCLAIWPQSRFYRRSAARSIRYTSS